MQDTRTAAPPKGTGLGFFLLGVVASGLLIVAGFTDYGTWAAPLIAAALMGISIPILARQSARENDPRLFRLLVLALALKLVGGVVRHYVAFDIYGGVADAAGYYTKGVHLATAFHHGLFHTGLASLTGTNFIRLLSGVVISIIGPSRIGGFLFFSWLGFWGLFLFYRAFVLGVSEGRKRTYARLVFFLPSLLFWPSSIGKEAWMMFALGIVAFGAARIYTGRVRRGLAIAGTGLWLAGLVRPPVAGLLALALVAGFLLHRSQTKSGELGLLVKVLGLGVISVVAVLLLLRTQSFLEQSGLDTSGGLNSVLSQTAERSGEGGSSFAPSVLHSPTRAPSAFVTVLFRPLTFEVRSLQALAAAAETTFLLLLSLLRIKWILQALRSIRRQSYVAMAIAYTGLFVVAFSSIANFGILARERVQLFPLYLVLLSIPPIRTGRRFALSDLSETAMQ